ncbi:MAG TPA: hypothetical protein VFU42_10035 [Candidatus Deferrimicrobiaceae bacterium]|nr:hypothetical protein [Candidatus Deferrimicrobiaceae bacterium]
MSSSPFRMLSGFNHNLRYKGRTYHVQTEDGGRENSMITTHVFLGGAILSTTRQTYRDLLSRPGWEESLRERMKIQHLDEIRKLFSGAFDPMVEDASADD